ncbi:hypothetical protein CDD82_2167 [Ophiocordyceps australis]|uniref:Ubiquitin-like domain-containing protein n=1 Tax=Ophiocordyceps australis TaxID=1399860 RepID=A0A2C5ZKM3_9HYPO|nr:hypothetical protein CDD82_2167 [Ophiocordyceps australis]
MATEPPKSRPQGSAQSPEPLLVNLQVVSPSVGVTRPLLFPELPATTTIKQLKDRIRQTLPLQPADDNQRLIHRGRALLRDSDSLLDVLGSEALRTSERQTIHLVIRDTSEAQPARTPHGPNPPDLGQAGNAIPVPSQPRMPQTGAAEQMHSAGLAPRSRPAQIPQPRMPSPASFPFANEQAAVAFQQQHQNLTTWLNQMQQNVHLQREALMRARANQSQRGRAQMATRGVGDSAALASGNGQEVNSRMSPGTANTVHYETVGPNGLTYHVDTVVRASTAQQTGLSPQDVHNILRVADANQATLAITNAMQRSASGPPLPSRPVYPAGILVPPHGPGSSLAGNGGATPDLESRSNAPTTSAGASPSLAQVASSQVYILMSPEGPRALLFNNSASDSYFTPRLRTPISLPLLRSASNMSPLPLPNHSSSSQQNHQAIMQQDEQAQAQHQPADAAFLGPPAMQAVRPDNHEAGGFPPLLLQFWPHIWLIFRLGLFVWFFTSPSSSWSRWLTIVCLAIFMFVLSTGLLNGIAEGVWRPIGRHLDNLLPIPDQQQQQPLRRQDDVVLGLNQDAQSAARGQDGTRDQIAARLVVQHQARPSWLASQVRRIERAGLLFLASLAPGVAERHIANLEAELQAEENRSRRDAEADMAAAADQTGTEANTANLNDSGSNEITGAGRQSEEPGEHGSDGVNPEEPRREGEIVARQEALT